MSDPIIKLGDYVKACEDQEKLEDKLKAKLDSKDSKLNRCTYNDKEGYQFQ